jgi:hypothetical protein
MKRKLTAVVMTSALTFAGGGVVYAYASPVPPGACPRAAAWSGCCEEVGPVVGVRLDRRGEERRGARGATAHGPGTGRDVGQQMYQRGRRRAGGSPAPLRPPRAFMITRWLNG